MAFRTESRAPGRPPRCVLPFASASVRRAPFALGSTAFQLLAALLIVLSATFAGVAAAATPGSAPVPVSSPAEAQTGTASGDTSPSPSGGADEGPAGPIQRVTDLRDADPAALADRAVRRWLDSANDAVTLRSLASDPEAFCRELPALFAAPPTLGDTQVNFDDRQEREVDPSRVPEGAERKRYTYSASTGDILQVVEVIVERPAGAATWQPVSVGFFEPASQNGRAWLRGAWASGLFIALSVFVLFDLVRGGRLRGWLREGVATIREHRGIVVATMVLLYGIFGLGMAAGAALPASCADAIQTILTSALNDVGATQAVATGNPIVAATVIFFQNFFIVTVSVLFGASLLFGLPAYLVAAVSFFVQAVPFGLLGTGAGSDPVGLVLVAILLLLELTAYFLVVAGGGMFLAGIVRGGFAGLPKAFRSLVLMLPIAGMLLWIGAWYEAVVVLLGG